jgi:Clr5 domain
MAFQAFRWGNKSLQGPSSSPIGQDEWDQHRELLRHLYSEADMTLEATMEYMRVHHDFTPSYVHQAKPSIALELVFFQGHVCLAFSRTS